MRLWLGLLPWKLALGCSLLRITMLGRTNMPVNRSAPERTWPLGPGRIWAPDIARDCQSICIRNTHPSTTVLHHHSQHPSSDHARSVINYWPRVVCLFWQVATDIFQSQVTTWLLHQQLRNFCFSRHLVFHGRCNQYSQIKEWRTTKTLLWQSLLCINLFFGGVIIIHSPLRMVFFWELSVQK